LALTPLHNLNLHLNPALVWRRTPRFSVKRVGLSMALGLAVRVFAVSGFPSLPAEAERAQATEPAKSEPDATYALAGLNKSFRAAYAKARQEILRQGGPVILTSGDNVVLLRDGKRSEVRVVPENYHT